MKFKGFDIVSTSLYGHHESIRPVCLLTRRGGGGVKGDKLSAKPGAGGSFLFDYLSEMQEDPGDCYLIEFETQLPNCIFLPRDC